MSTVDVETRTGVSYRRLDYWIRLGLIDQPGTPGSGYRREWTEDDLRRVFVAVQIMNWSPSTNSRHGGVPVRSLIEAIDYTADEVVAATPDGTVHRTEWPPGSILIDVAYARRRAAEVFDG